MSVEMDRVVDGCDGERNEVGVATSGDSSVGVKDRGDGDDDGSDGGNGGNGGDGVR